MCRSFLIWLKNVAKVRLSEHFGGVGEGREFLKAEHDVVITASFKVGTSTTATKEGVAREKHLVFLGIEADAAT